MSDKIINDNMGQWNHPGEITRIYSKYITMDNVPYDVFAIDANGNKKMMKPNREYIFEKGPVTEYPTIGKNGNESPYSKLKKAQGGIETSNYEMIPYDESEIIDEQIPIDNANEIQIPNQNLSILNNDDVIPATTINEDNGIIQEEKKESEIEDVNTNNIQQSFLDEDINPEVKEDPVLHEKTYDPEVQFRQQILADNGYYDSIVKGYSKQDIMRIQRILKSKGYNLGTSGPNHDGIDGIYGSRTSEAWNKYNVDGIDGKFTQEATRREQVDMMDQIKKNKSKNEGFDGNDVDDILGNNSKIEDDTFISNGTIKEDDGIESNVTIKQQEESSTKNVTIENENGKQTVTIPSGGEKKEVKKDYNGDNSLKKEIKEDIESVQSFIEGLKSIFENPQEYKDLIDFPEGWLNMSQREQENWFINNILNSDDDKFASFKKYIGDLPLLISGAKYVTGGGIPLDREDFHIRESGISFSFLDFSKDGREFHPYVVNSVSGKGSEHETQCSAGMQFMMMQGGFTDLQKYGIKGDAWTMLDNMASTGNSKIVYNSFDTYDLGIASTLKGQEDNVRRFLRNIISTDEYKQATSNIKVGDVVSLYYSGSPKYLISANAQTNRKNKCYSTHIGVVVKGDNGRLYVWHNSGGVVHMTPLSEATDESIKDKHGDIQITGIARMGSGATSMEAYYDCSRFGVTPSPTSKDLNGKSEQIQKYDKLFGPSGYRAMGAISQNKDSLMAETGITNNNDFDYLYALTLGEMYQESGMGSSSLLLEKRFGIKSNREKGFKDKINHFGENIKGVIGDIGSRLGLDKKSETFMQSTGLSNIKPLKNYTEEELRNMGIYNLYFGSDLTKEEKHLIQSSPEYTAQLTFKTVSKNSEILDALLEQEGFPEELKVKNKDNEFYNMMMSMIWNQGFGDEKKHPTLDTIKKVKYLYDEYGMKEVNKYIESVTNNNSWSNVRRIVQYVDIDTSSINNNNYSSPYYQLDEIVVTPKKNKQADKTYENYFKTTHAGGIELNQDNEDISYSDTYKDDYLDAYIKLNAIKESRNKDIVNRTNQYLSYLRNATVKDKRTVSQKKKDEEEKKKDYDDYMNSMYWMASSNTKSLNESTKKLIKKTNIGNDAKKIAKRTYREIASVIN